MVISSKVERLIVAQETTGRYRYFHPLNNKGENMYKHLYDSFSHWYRGGSIYFYSDPHFNDDEMKLLTTSRDHVNEVMSVLDRLGK